MTMADTIAVMNQGVIEQLGAPADLYENPVTTFVANFLGQSNLLLSETVESGGDVVVSCHGQRLGVEQSRAHSTESRGWLGVRPEKIVADPAGTVEQNGHNVLTGGVVTDVSFIGVSTQYLVQMPWEQEIMVFEQNTGQRTSLRTGDKVDLSWRREHSFLLDASQDAGAGMIHPEDKE